MRGYEFADPSIVQAFYDSDEPLEGRTMLLQIRFHGLRFHVGARVREVYDRRVEDGGRVATVWGWAYGTLAGHFEMGQMDWQVWKWEDTGEVEFRIHAYSRRAPVANPIVRRGIPPRRAPRAACVPAPRAAPHGRAHRARGRPRGGPRGDPRGRRGAHRAGRRHDRLAGAPRAAGR